MKASQWNKSPSHSIHKILYQITQKMYKIKIRRYLMVKILNQNLKARRRNPVKNHKTKNNTKIPKVKPRIKKK